MTLTKEQAMFISDTAKYKIIGICTSCVQSDYVRDIVSSISRKGVKEGYKVLLFNTFCDLYHNISYNHGEASVPMNMVFLSYALTVQWIIAAV